jgi:hypothetical protein
VVRVGADGRIAIIRTAHDIRPRRRAHLGKRAPGGVWVGGHARRVEENADGIAIEAILDEHVVVGRDEEVIPGSNASDAKLDTVVKQLLVVGKVDDAVGLAATDLLDIEDVANVVPG